MEKISSRPSLPDAQTEFTVGVRPDQPGQGAACWVMLAGTTPHCRPSPLQAPLHSALRRTTGTAQGPFMYMRTPPRSRYRVLPLPQKVSCPSSRSAAPRREHHSDFYHQRLVCLFWNFHIHAIKTHVFFCAWLLLVSMTSGRADQAVSVSVQYCNLFIHSLLMDLWIVSSFW